MLRPPGCRRAGPSCGPADPRGLALCPCLLIPLRRSNGVEREVIDAETCGCVLKAFDSVSDETQLQAGWMRMAAASDQTSDHGACLPTACRKLHIVVAEVWKAPKYHNLPQ